MADNIVVQLIIFFVATAITIVSSHIALIRLMANGEAADIKSIIDKEKKGVLIVIEFALVILMGAPIPVATTLITPGAHDQFIYAVWIIPIVILILAVIDLIITKGSNAGRYYYIVAAFVCLSSVALLVLHCLNATASSVQFFAALSLSLVVIVAQFLKSALRFAGIVS
jgi:hypothetical protein